MRILLCSSYLGAGNQEPLVFPIGLGYIAAMLKGHDVIGWDTNAEKDPINGLGRILEDFNPELVCVSLRNIDSIFYSKQRSYYDPFVSLIRTIREKSPSSKLIVGGPGFSTFAKEIMEQNPEIDFGVVSEGERAIVDLLKNLDHPERVKNLVIRKEGKVVFTQKDELIDFNSLPPPSRECFDLTKYTSDTFAIGIQSSRGCGFGCIYCLHKFLMGSCYRLRSPKKVADEIEILLHKHGIRGFYFVEPVFNVPFDYSRAILNEIKNRKLDIEWEACFRPDFLNERLMREAVDTGCQLFDFSPDGASNEALQLLGKNLEVRDIEKSINWAAKIENAKVAYEFVYDLPHGNLKHVAGLTRLFPKILGKCSNKLRYLTLTKMRIFPHTSLYNMALNEGKISTQTDLMYPVHYESYSSKSPYNLFPFFLNSYQFAFTKLHNTFFLK